MGVHETLKCFTAAGFIEDSFADSTSEIRKTIVRQRTGWQQIKIYRLKKEEEERLEREKKEEEERLAKEKEEEERRKKSPANKLWGWMKKFGQTIVQADNENM